MEHLQRVWQPTGDAYSSGHLFPSHLRLAYVLLVVANPYSEFLVIFPDYALSCNWIYVATAVFQPYRDLEAGDNQSLKIQVARPGIEPRSSCSASQELYHSATAAPENYLLS